MAVHVDQPFRHEGAGERIVDGHLDVYIDAPIAWDVLAEALEESAAA